MDASRDDSDLAKDNLWMDKVLELRSKFFPSKINLKEVDWQTIAVEMTRHFKQAITGEDITQLRKRVHRRESRARNEAPVKDDDLDDLPSPLPLPQATPKRKAPQPTDDLKRTPEEVKRPQKKQAIDTKVGENQSLPVTQPSQPHSEKSSPRYLPLPLT